MSSPAAVLHGPALIGIFINAILYGTALLQAVTYYQESHRDPLWMKVYVGVLIFSDTLSTAFIQAWVYRVLILNFMNPAALLELDWLLATDPALVGITATMVHCFFAWRIKLLTKSIVIPIGIAVVSLAGCIAGIIFSVYFATYPSLLSLATEQSARVLASIWLIPPVVADITITIVLSYLHSARTGYSQTEGIINKLIRLTVQNGLITTTVALIDLITFLAMPSSGIHIGFNVPMTKLYTNSVLSSLNARRNLRGQNASDYYSTPHGVASTLNRPAPEVFVSVEMNTEGAHQDYPMNKTSGWAHGKSSQ